MFLSRFSRSHSIVEIFVLRRKERRRAAFSVDEVTPVSDALRFERGAVCVLDYGFDDDSPFGQPGRHRMARAHVLDRYVDDHAISGGLYRRFHSESSRPQVAVQAEPAVVRRATANARP